MSQPAQSQAAQSPFAGTDDEPGTKPFSWRFTTPLFIGSALNPINSSLIATALVPIAAGVHVSIGLSSRSHALALTREAMARADAAEAVPLRTSRAILLD